MALCRYLPTPSDRMAALWTLLTIKDAAVLEYGPAGTTHYSVSMFGAMGVSPNQNLFTTHMSEDDVIMGDVTRLEDALEEIDENYSPKVIFVVASSVSSVIGTDIKGVCRYMQDQVQAKLIPIETGGFKGDYSVGLRTIYSTLEKNLIGQSGNKIEKSYNVLGASAHAYRIKSDLWEIENLMQESFGYHVNAVLGMETTVDALGKMGDAQINLVLRAEALPAAQKMQEKYGIPYVYGAPYGYEGTGAWLQEIAKVLDTPVSEAMEKTLKQRKDLTIDYKMYARMYAAKPQKPNAAVMADYDTLCGLTNLLKEINMPISLRACPHSLQMLDDADPSIRTFETERMQIDAFRALEHSLVFADEVSLHLCSESNTTLCVSFPLVKRAQIATHLPIMGIRGMDSILESVETYYNTLP